MPLNADLMFQISCMARLIYFVTDEDDRLVVQLKKDLPKLGDNNKAWVFNAALGMKPIDEYINTWTTREQKVAGKEGAVAAAGGNIHDALIEIYTSDPKENIHTYVILDAERWMEDKFAVRRILNILHQGNQNIHTCKVLILVGTRKVIPQYLARYVTIVNDTGPDEDEVASILAEAGEYVEDLTIPENSEKLFQGMTSFETRAAISQSIVRTSGEQASPRIDRDIVTKFRQQQFSKTDLLTYIDTSKYDMALLGGVSRFKEWALKAHATWTPEGQAFGLKPPKGVLCVGVWGCGKSLSMKVLGHLWRLPVVQLELGRIRSSAVGESEANAYRVLRLIESAAPCLVWLDEAEKSLSGMASSAQSDAGITNRIIGIFSTWIQETKAPVCLGMTANSLSTLPVEFVNRMNERFFFDMPSEADRADILKIHLQKAGQDPARFNLVDLAGHAKQMVGREIEQAIESAMIESYHAKKDHLDQDILASILIRKPRIVKTMQDEIQQIVDWVGYDAEADDGVKARFASKPERYEAKAAIFDE